LKQSNFDFLILESVNMIECKNISKIYKNGSLETQALKNISFKINEGEFVAIIGPSGSGKSTLMHILGCLDMPTSGEYIFNGKNISKLSDDELAEFRRNKIGFVFQMFNLLPRATVLRNVMLPLIYAGVGVKEREEKAKKALTASAFPEKFWYHFSNQLSGGMQQRVAIARALVNNPQLILADEPTGNLDSKTGDIVIKTLIDLNKKGHTLVIVTHELYIARYAKRVIALKDGEIVEDALTEKSKSLKIIKE
jgi:putative ABC transport system ATP-binding protein